MVTSQIMSESLGQPPKGSSWLCAEKNSKSTHSKVKESLFREIHTLQSECGPFQKARDPDLKKILFSSCEVTQVCQAILQLWWVEPNIGGADAASWRTNTFCMSYIDCLIFCQNFS